MSEALRVESVESLVKESAWATGSLLGQLSKEPETDISVCRFFGHQYVRDGGRGDRRAMADLLGQLDHAIVWGNANGERPLEFDGLLRLAGQPMQDRDAFYARVSARDNPRQAEGVLLIDTAAPGFFGEGDLPPKGKFTIALSPNAVVWRQLMPFQRIPLAPMREGYFMVAIDRSPVREPKHENSATRDWAALVVYGRLELRDPSGLFVLQER